MICAPRATVWFIWSLEFVEGRTLDALLHDRERFSPKEALALLDPIASVLDAAHAMGVVHRDLKPENVMIGQSAVKLLDLGIAKMREIAEGGGAVATSLTVAGQILGTPYYMSPEQWGEISRDGNPEIDSRADIYSLGVMFYELITGRKPFGGATLAELRRGHVSFTPEPLHEVAPDVPEQFSRVITRAISKDRNDRQPTAGKLIEEIRAALNLTASPSLTSALNPTNTQGLPADPATATADFARPTGADLPAPTIVSINNATPPSPSR
ncbi:MAG: serine/threonine-protein kinase [Pyrinomonadaceae bacterium]